MAKEQNIAAQEKLGEMIGKGELDGFDEIFAADVVDHDPAPDQAPGAQGYKDFFSTMHTAFPDLGLEVEQLVADDDNIAIAYTMTGTHEGEFQGVAPSGNKVSVRGLQIARFEDGRIVERWGATDERTLLEQIGAGPAS
jgi:steroid delta-isomerase-like uncharacterized protein